MENMNRRVRELLNEAGFTDKMGIKYHLFGSRVWGGSTESSDIDVLLYIPTMQEDGKKKDYNGLIQEVIYCKHDGYDFNLCITNNPESYAILSHNNAIVSNIVNGAETDRNQRVALCVLVESVTEWLHAGVKYPEGNENRAIYKRLSYGELQYNEIEIPERLNVHTDLTVTELKEYLEKPKELVFAPYIKEIGDLCTIRQEYVAKLKQILTVEWGYAL